MNATRMMRRVAQLGDVSALLKTIDDEPSARAHHSAPGDTAPWTPVERKLADIWQHLLGCTDVERDANFFRAGGHSLLGVEMLSHVHREWGVHIELIQLFQQPRLADLAMLVEAAAVVQPSSRVVDPLVCLRPGNMEDAFFCVDPIGDPLRYLEPLASAGGAGRPFYALRPTDADGGAASIEAMAARCLAALRVARPHGPYVVGGWSTGGLVAFELSRQLRAAGERVALVVLIDVLPPELARQIRMQSDGSSDQGRFCQAILRLLGQDGDARVPAPLCGGDPWAALVDVVSGIEAWPRERTIEELRHLLHRFSHNALAADQYEPAPLDARMALFTAAETQHPGKLTHAWTQWAGDQLEIHPVPGNHYSMLQPPRVAELADRIWASIDRANGFDEMTSWAQGSMEPGGP